MARRGVDELVAGMVLAEDVLTPGGRFLMPRGTVLDAGHLKSLQAWNVLEASVEAGDVAEGQALSPAGDAATSRADAWEATVAAIQDGVRERLRHVDATSPAGQTLFSLAVDRELARLEHGATGRSGEDAARLVTSPDSPSLPPVSAEAMLRDEPQLVSPPEVYSRVSRVLRDPASTVEDAADAIRHDQSLAAKLLRLVNSSFYARTMRAVNGRFPTKVDSLSRAVMVVGARQLSTLALGVSVLPLFQDIPQGWVNMRLFWEHSVGCAVAAQAIAYATRRGNPETLFVGGLMHDIGRIILFKQAPQHMAAAMRRALSDRVPLTVAETQVLSFDHAALGGLLLHKWEFPTHLETMVSHHHALAGEHIEEQAIIHLADALANALAWGGSGSRYVPALDPRTFDVIGLAPQTLAELLPEMEANLTETMRGFFPEHEGIA